MADLTCFSGPEVLPFLGSLILALATHRAVDGMVKRWVQPVSPARAPPKTGHLVLRAPNGMPVFLGSVWPCGFCQSMLLVWGGLSRLWRGHVTNLWGHHLDDEFNMVVLSLSIIDGATQRKHPVRW